MNKESGRLKNTLKIYEVDFDPVYPTSNGLIILAKNKSQASKMAEEHIKHTSEFTVSLIKSDKPKVIYFSDGDY